MTAVGRSQTVTDTQIASPMPGGIHSMKHWKLSQMRTLESPPVIFLAKPCARTGRKKTAESNQHEVLGNHSGQAQQIRLEFGLGSQLWVPKDERCGLLTPTAIMTKVRRSI